MPTDTERRGPRREGDAWREHEATQRERFGEGRVARDDVPSPEQQQAGAARSVRGGGPVGTPEGPPAATLKAGGIEQDEGIADMGPRGRTEEHGEEAAGRGKPMRVELEEGKRTRDVRQRWPPV